MQPNRTNPPNPSGLSEEQRNALMRQLCTVSASILQLRQLVDTLLECQVSPAAIMVYSKLQWAALDPIAYSAYADQVLQKIMHDLALRSAEKAIRQAELSKEGRQEDGFEPPQAKVRF
jgi:hypothetical protein